MYHVRSHNLDIQLEAISQCKGVNQIPHIVEWEQLQYRSTCVKVQGYHKVAEVKKVVTTLH